MPSQQVEVVNDVGLHTRPLAQFVTKARSFPETTIRVSLNNRTADAKSLVGMMALEALKGTIIEITTEGPQAEEALQALAEMVASGFTRR